MKTPRYTKEVLQYHVLKLQQMGLTRAQINQATGLNLERLFNDGLYLRKKSQETYRIVKLLHETDYHKVYELPETLELVNRPTSFNAYLLNSRTVVDLLNKMIEFNSACYPDNEFGLQENADSLMLYIKQPPAELSYSTAQGILFYIIMMCKSLLNDSSIAIKVGTTSSALPDITTFEQYASADITYNTPYSYLSMAKSLAYTEVGMYNQKIAFYLQQQFANNYSAQPALPELKEMIRGDLNNALSEEKDGRFFNIDFISARYGLSRATLYRKLQSEGTSFSQLTEDFKRHKAAELLTSGFLSMEEISDKLGYSNLTAFNRAFRRWYNTSPAKFREQN